MLGDSVKPIFDAGLLHLVDLDHAISPEIRLTSSIGPTPGHVSVTIESEGEQAVITGDMTHHPCQMAHPDWSLGDSDPDAAARFRVGRAVKLLHETDLPCAEIAIEGDFCDQTHMIRTFRRVLERLPSAVRDDKGHCRPAAVVT